MLINSPIGTGEKSKILASLELLESLVEICDKTTVPSSANGICLAIVSESVIAYRLITNAAYRHMQFTFIDDDIDVNCNEWTSKLDRLISNMKKFESRTVYSTSLTKSVMRSILADKHSLSKMWDARRIEDNRALEIRVNEYGMREIDRLEFENWIIDDMQGFRNKVYEAVEKDILSKVNDSIDSWRITREQFRNIDKEQIVKDCLEVWPGIAQTVHYSLNSVRFALSQLGQSRDGRNIPDFMYEEFAHISMNEFVNQINTAINELDIKWSCITGEQHKRLLNREIDEEWKKASDHYDRELFDSFINHNDIKNAERKGGGYCIFKSRRVFLNINMIEFGRYLYSCYEGGTSREHCEAIILFMCRMTYLYELLYENNAVKKAHTIEWTDKAKAIFNDSVMIKDKMMHVNLDYFNKFLRNNLQNGNNKIEYSYQWIIVSLLAKHFGFLELQKDKQRKPKFVGTKLGDLLNSDGWEFGVKSSDIARYSYLVTSDELQDLTTDKLTSCKKPEDISKECTDAGLNSIQEKLNFCLENIDINELFIGQ